MAQAQKVDRKAGGFLSGMFTEVVARGHHVPQHVPGVSSQSQAAGPWRLEAAPLRPPWGVWGEDPRSADTKESPAFCLLTRVTWETAPAAPGWPSAHPTVPATAQVSVGHR